MNEPRPARPEDNDALVALSVACPMEGDVALAVDRHPDFFALNRLEGDAWQVGVVDGPEGRPVGCIAVAERRIHRNGEPAPAMYVSDLKVHPDYRGAGVADRLSEWAAEACVAVGGPDVLTFLTVLAGNRSMERRMAGPRGLPHTERVTTIRTHIVPLLKRRRPPGDDPATGVTVRSAGPDDLEEMAELWARWSPSRHFTAVHTASSLAGWIEAAPGLEISSYRLAHRRVDGRLAGFIGVWDQFALKRLRVTGYSRRLAAVRVAFNAVAPLAGATRLPAPGGPLRNLSAVQTCVWPDDPRVLRALVIDAHNRALRRGYSFFNIGLDVDDPLAAAMGGLWAQPTDVWLCTASVAGREPVVILDGRPSHHEIALV